MRVLTNGRDLEEVARTLLDAIDPDKLEQAGGDAAAKAMKEQAARVFDSPPLRRLLIDLKAQSEVVVNEITPDAVVSSGFDQRQAEETTGRFKRFLEEKKSELLALQILYSRPYGVRGLTHQAVRDLADTVARPPWNLSPPTIWQAYKRLYADRVRAGPSRLLSDIVALVRFALDPQTRTLEPLSASVEQRFNLWLGREKNAGRTYAGEQLAWLNLIKSHIAANAVIERDDLQHAPDFVDRGGLIAARRVFGAQLDVILDNLADALVA